jgi:TatD DNase family protein
MIDTHAHLNSDKLFDNRAELIEEAIKNNVEVIVNIGCDIETSKKVVEIANQFKNIYAVVGFHPHEASKFDNKAREEIQELAKHKKVVALGEIGLDFYYNFSSKEKQIEVFVEQIKLANKLKLPVVIHSRDATNQVLEILENNEKFLKNSGIIHCFGESFEIAKRYIDLGFVLGIGGMITFKNSELKNIIKQIGLENIVLETDCPYLAPVPFRGKLNQPAYVKYVRDYIAEILQISAEEVDRVTTLNAKKVYKI